MNAFEQWLDGEIQQIHGVADEHDRRGGVGRVGIADTCYVNGRQRALLEVWMAYTRLKASEDDRDGIAEKVSEQQS